MAIRTIPLSRLETDLGRMLNECAESGQAMIVELPNHHFLTIRPMDPEDEDSLTDDLLANDAQFQALLAKSKASPRKPFGQQV